MGKQYIQNENGMIYLQEQLGKFERVNYEEMKALANGVIPQLLPVQMQVKGKKEILEIYVQDSAPISAYYSENMKQRFVLSLLTEIVRIAMECERMGLRSENLSWSWDMIFMDSHRRLHMVYWPVVRLEPTMSDPLTFFRGFWQIMSSSGMDPRLVQLYGSYFYQRENFDLFAFHQMMQQVMEFWTTQREEQKRQQEQISGNLRSGRSGALGGGYFPVAEQAKAWLETASGSKQFTLHRDITMIGRDAAQCHVCVTSDAGISRSHAMIRKDESGFYLVDLNSRNGTFHAGKRLEPQVQVKLSDGDKLVVSKTVFVFRQEHSEHTIQIHQLQRRT